MGMRSLRIGVRLTIGFGVLAALVLVVALVGFEGLHAGSQKTDELVANEATSKQAETLQFLAADLNGWQTAYAFDVLRGVPGAAEDDGESRAAFVASAARFDEETAALGASDLTADERAALERTIVAFDEFMRVDERVAWRIGRARRRASAPRTI